MWSNECKECCSCNVDIVNGIGDIYFVCYRYRNFIDKEYMKKFFREEKNLKLHNTPEEAYREQLEGFYDDCDYGIVARYSNGEFNFVPEDTVTMKKVYEKWHKEITIDFEKRELDNAIEYPGDPCMRSVVWNNDSLKNVEYCYGYFICFRNEAIDINIEYAKEFFKKFNPKIYKKARQALDVMYHRYPLADKRCFRYCIIGITSDNRFKFLSRDIFYPKIKIIELAKKYNLIKNGG